MKPVKIIVDILMLVFIILSVVRWESDPTFHIIVGSGCTLFFIIHFLVNIKPFKAMTKRFGKLKVMIKLQYTIDALLIIVWSIAIISGFIAIPYYMEEAETAFKIGRLHGIFARVGCGLAGIHLLQHLKQIRSYFRHTK